MVASRRTRSDNHQHASRDHLFECTHPQDHRYRNDLNAGVSYSAHLAAAPDEIRACRRTVVAPAFADKR
jgi:hypothetical protein